MLYFNFLGYKIFQLKQIINKVSSSHDKGNKDTKAEKLNHLDNITPDNLLLYFGKQNTENKRFFFPEKTIHSELPLKEVGFFSNQ